MAKRGDIEGKLRALRGGRLLFLPHAVRQMARTDRMISPKEVRCVIEGGDIIEDYPEDVRGHSCLILGCGDARRPPHVVCAPKDEYVAVITAYLPDPKEWTGDFRARTRP